MHMVAPLFQGRVNADSISVSGFDLVIGNARDIAATLALTDYDVDGVPAGSDLARLTLELTPVLSAERDGAAAHLGVLNGTILIAALGRAIARTIGRGVLAVDVDGHIIALDCVTPGDLDATELLAHVCSALGASTVRQPGQELAELSFRCVGAVTPTVPLAGHALEVRAYRRNGLVQLDLWFDTRRFEEYTIAELIEQFPNALIEVCSEAVPNVDDAA